MYFFNNNISEHDKEIINKMEADVDAAFIQRVINEVRVSCALPLQIPVEQIESYIRQAAQWFWEMDNSASEERSYLIMNKDFCQGDKLNKTIKLPPQIISVHGVFKANNTYGGVMGDFSVERMMMQNYTFNYGNVSAGYMNGSPSFNLPDVISGLYELSTYSDILNTPLTYDYNRNTNILVILGNLKWSNIIINVYQRCKIQDLYNYYWFFRYVVCLVKRGLATIYGSLEFKLPGGVTINYSKFKDEADEELDKIDEWVKTQYAADYFYMSNNN